MPRHASPFAILGLEPGADRAAIERAYKRLIKLYHPDRKGGDGPRAAEINRAYRELRNAPPKAVLELLDYPLKRRGSRGRWILVTLCAVAAAGTWLVAGGPIAPPVVEDGRLIAGTVHPPLKAAAAAPQLDAMDEPLGTAEINQAVQDAEALSRSADDMGLVAASEDCHGKLRSDPSVDQLDRCAAFDDAVVQLQGRDPSRDVGEFSEIAVTGRQWSAASALSDDYMAIESRLDRIRLRVEMTLAPLVAGRSD